MSSGTDRAIGDIEILDEQGSDKIGLTMQLFGLPYQFLPTVDQRVPGISSTLGRKYVESIIMEAPVVTIIPGKPRYLPGSKDKVSVTNALISAANGNFAELQQLRGDATNVRLYDFQPAYAEFMQYVNMMNRATAGFLELGDVDYRINGSKVDFTSYDWKNYRWDGKKYKGTTQVAVTNVGKSVSNTLASFGRGVSTFAKNLSQGKISFQDNSVMGDEESIDERENMFVRNNYIQFYATVDSADVSESESNSTTQSILKQTLDTASGSVRDIAYLLDTGTGGAASKFQELGDSTLTALNEALGGNGSVNDAMGGIVSRLLSAGKSVIRGDNISMPDIWSGSDMGKSYSINIPFKAMYGNKLSLYTDVLAGVNMCIALAYPRATSANSYKSPFMVKYYQKGGGVCNLGVVTGITINKKVSGDSRNVDGLCTEVDVSLSITDLDADMAISPANDPMLFLQNSSLVEYLANSCGLDLLQPQLSQKAKLIWNTGINSIADLPKTIGGGIMEKLDEAIMNFTGL